MWKTAIALVTVACLASTTDAQNCPIGGITTTDVGQATGFLQPSRLILTWDAANCRLGVEVSAFSCCNTYASQHFIVFGDQLLATPVALGRPFFAGSQLYVRRAQIYGPLPLITTFDVPPDPSLVGQTFVAQAAPVYFTTIGFRTSYAMTQGVVFTFQ